jgi:hypothetical protein
MSDDEKATVGGLSRRKMIAGSIAAGGAVWAAPVITSAAAASTGSPAPATDDLTLSPGRFFANDAGTNVYVFSETGGTRRFTVTNSGTAPSGQLQLQFDSPSPSVTLADDTCTGATLAPGGTCTFDVTVNCPGAGTSPGNVQVLDVGGNSGISLNVSAACSS